MGLLIGKFHKILTELSAQDILFPDDNLINCQRILTKLCTCIDIKESWFGIADGQISSSFDKELSAHDMNDNGGVLSFYVFINPKVMIFFLFLYENICFGFSLEHLTETYVFMKK